MDEELYQRYRARGAGERVIERVNVLGYVDEWLKQLEIKKRIEEHRAKQARDLEILSRQWVC